MTEYVCFVIVRPVAELIFYLWVVRTAMGNVCAQLLV